MNDWFHEILMILVAIISGLTLFLCRKLNKQTVVIGFICWIALSAYFMIEAIVIRATTAPYNFLKQPMSDLGVTTCGTDTYVLAQYDICSPYHWLMNWTFYLTGLAIFIGAILLYRLWPKARASKIATVCICTFGISYGISGIIPADVHFYWHTLSALPGMVVQIPAMILISKVTYKKLPYLAWWTIICTVVTTTSLFILFLQPIFADIPGGLLQRILYGSVYWWLAGTAIILWRKRYFALH
ncbi:hypothetical protein J14TS2_14080 [Bacillus sp. J14TS2]|uniref:DUF998 domain-containing protein n=1 Tax=Bacillus sp. J14TS2 TaxID=2807188 RepID=UPI001AFDF102|nr:DUF998 domain-containing protein [Bacillus sp. J14TS2]GIN70933.1 hypothetical protein J14TS2_14080 [Bacillus sp. J14TS2]